VNPYTGLSYASDPTIIGYETGNELGGPVFGDKNVPVAWVREICQLIKSLGPEKLCLDGTYGVNATHFEVEEVDIFSDHFYPLNNTKLLTGIEAVETAGRVYSAGELDWTGFNGGDSLQSFYDVIEARQKSAKPVVSGSMFWSLFGRDVPDCSVCTFRRISVSLLTWVQRYVNHSDSFTLQYNNPANSLATTVSIATIRKNYFAMENITVDDYLPAVVCPHSFIPEYEAEYTYV
jgi:mannan endo-1,4-beta-mannosidase